MSELPSQKGVGLVCLVWFGVVLVRGFFCVLFIFWLVGLGFVYFFPHKTFLKQVLKFYYKVPCDKKAKYIQQLIISMVLSSQLFKKYCKNRVSNFHGSVMVDEMYNFYNLASKKN